MKRTPNFKSQSLLSLTIFYIVHVLFFFSSKVLFYIFIFFSSKVLFLYFIFFSSKVLYFYIFIFYIFFFLKSFIFLFYFSSKVLFYIFINQLLHQMEKRDSNIDSEKLYRAQTPI